MNIRKIAIGLLFVLLAVHLSGCIGPGDGLSGTYICKTCDGVLDLYGENQWELSSKECSYGNYTIRHEEVRLKMNGLGIFVPLKIEGRDLVDPDGDRWVRD